MDVSYIYRNGFVLFSFETINFKYRNLHIYFFYGGMCTIKRSESLNYSQRIGLQVFGGHSSKLTDTFPTISRYDPMESKMIPETTPPPWAVSRNFLDENYHYYFLFFDSILLLT